MTSVSEAIFCLRQKSWKPECALSFNMGWRIKFTNIHQPMLKLKTHSGLEYFDSDMSNSTNTVLYFDWRTVIYIYICGQCRTQFMLPNSSIIHQHVLLRRESQSY